MIEIAPGLRRWTAYHDHWEEQVGSLALETDDGLLMIDPIDPRVESPEEVRDRVLEAAEVLPVDRLGSCDDCGFSPFADDTSTSRNVAFAKIAARVEGTRLASAELGV